VKLFHDWRRVVHSQSRTLSVWLSTSPISLSSRFLPSCSLCDRRWINGGFSGPKVKFTNSAKQREIPLKMPSQYQINTFDLSRQA
jgi:hypothetical protein